MTENLAGRGEGLAGLLEWLREQSEELMKSAIARESTAETMRAATPKELREAKALAEKMAGRRLPNVSTGSEEAKIEADVQCRIAAKLSERARQISAWADELETAAAAPAGTARDKLEWALMLLEQGTYALRGFDQRDYPGTCKWRDDAKQFLAALARPSSAPVGEQKQEDGV